MQVPAESRLEAAPATPAAPPAASASFEAAAQAAEARQQADEILGMNLVTHQTGPEGKLVRKVYVEADTAAKAANKDLG